MGRALSSSAAPAPPPPLDYSIESFCLTSRKDIESGVCLCVSLFHRIQERKILKSRTWNEEETRISLVGVCRYREAGGGGATTRVKTAHASILCAIKGIPRERKRKSFPGGSSSSSSPSFSFYLEEEEEAVAAKRIGIDGRV